MDHDTFLSMVVDEILKDGYARQRDAAHAAARRYFVEKDEVMVGKERYGIVDFVIRLLTDMRVNHHIEWTPQHDKFVINDFACVINQQGLLTELRKIAPTVPIKQNPFKSSKMIRTISYKWSEFESKMGKAVPARKRYMRISLIAMYADYIGRQLAWPEHYKHIKTGVTAGHMSFLPSIGRVTGIKAISLLMDNASDVTMRQYHEAATRFKRR